MPPILKSVNKHNWPDHRLFYPRDYQIEALKQLDSGIKRVALCFHRRAGKDLLIFNWTIKELIKKKQMAYYILPTYAQAKKILWDGMTNEGKRFLDYIPRNAIEKKNESELKIWFTNGALFQLHGSENYDRLMGTNPNLCIFSEYALQNPRAWEYIRPILIANQGTAIFISTPRGKNHFYDLFIHGKNDKRWFSQLLTIEDTKAITEEQIEDEKRDGMSEDMVAQEFYCNFDMGIEGSFYGKRLDELYRENRITNVPYDSQTEVHTAWDLGIGDSTSIIFYQLCGQEIHIIDTYENQGEGLAHYAGIIKSKPYNFGNHFAPHDIEVRELGSGRSRLEIARELGISFQIIPNLRLEDGVESARGLFPRLWIDESRNIHFLKCLTNYRKEFNEKYNVYSTRPVHDWSSHFADAFRYMALSISRLRGKRMTAEETRRLRNENLGIIDRSKDNFFGM